MRRENRLALVAALGCSAAASVACVACGSDSVTVIVVDGGSTVIVEAADGSTPGSPPMTTSDAGDAEAEAESDAATNPDGDAMSAGVNDPPAAVPGQPAYTIDVSGGGATNGDGGAGGTIWLEPVGVGGAGLAIFATGVADASFAFPAYEPSFGAVAVDVTGTQSIGEATPDTATVGSYYFDSGTPTHPLLFAQDATHMDTRVTGVHVEASATLVLSAADAVVVPSDIVLEAGSSVRSTGSVVLTSGAGFVARAGAFIDTSGAATGDGGAGSNASPITIQAATILNEATLTAKGGDSAPGSVGGYGGAVQLLATSNGGPTLLVNSGSITTSSGANGAPSVTQVEQAGGIVLSSPSGNLYNSGALTADGGPGVGNGPGGNAATSVNLLQSSNGGALLNSGALTCSGGLPSAGCTGSDCVVGVPGQLGIQGLGGRIASSGSLRATGSGGTLFIWNGDGQDAAGNPVPFGATDISGDIILTGPPIGTPRSGADGDGGFFQLATAAGYGTTAAQRVRLLGYASVLANGGAGGGPAGNGGRGGQILMAQEAAEGDGDIDEPGGAFLVSYANVSATGGTSARAAGGGGGDIDLAENGDGLGVGVSTSDATAGVLFNMGSLDVSGGSGLTGGGSAGLISLDAYGAITTSGALRGRGGDASGADGQAGDAIGGSIFGAPGSPTVQVLTAGLLSNSGDVDVTGGSGSGVPSTGGAGGVVRFAGTAGLTNTGSIAAAGGSSTSGASAIVGGNGGSIALVSSGPFSGGAGPFDVSGGKGTPSGASGVVSLNGAHP